MRKLIDAEKEAFEKLVKLERDMRKISPHSPLIRDSANFVWTPGDPFKPFFTNGCNYYAFLDTMANENANQLMLFQASNIEWLETRFKEIAMEMKLKFAEIILKDATEKENA